MVPLKMATIQFCVRSVLSRSSFTCFSGRYATRRSSPAALPTTINAASSSPGLLVTTSGGGAIQRTDTRPIVPPSSETLSASSSSACTESYAKMRTSWPLIFTKCSAGRNHDVPRDWPWYVALTPVSDSAVTRASTEATGTPGFGSPGAMAGASPPFRAPLSSTRERSCASAPSDAVGEWPLPQAARDSANMMPSRARVRVR